MTPQAISVREPAKPRNPLLHLSLAAALTHGALCQTWEREVIDFPAIQSRAKDLANKPHVAPDREALPAWMKNLTYDQYRDLRFNADQALWAADKLPFRAMFFHPGYLFREPVTLNEFTATHQQRIRPSEDFFDYGKLVPKRGEFPPSSGFAGFKLASYFNQPGRLEFSFFNVEKCAGFGLVQRDRRFAAYEDGEAAYHLRPSLWIEPTSDWGAGRVVLMEIPTANELADNAVAMWEPAATPQPGDRVEFSYKQHWSMAEDPSQAGGHVVATRTGVHEWQPEQRTIIIEFAGGALDKTGDKDPEPFIQVLGDAATKVKIQGAAVQTMSPGQWRLGFQLTPAAAGGKLADLGPVELRACLKRGDDFLTEPWAYRIIP